MRLDYLRRRLPQLAESELTGLPPEFARYQRDLSQALHTLEKDTIRALKELDTKPAFSCALGTSQSLTANTLTTVAFDTVIVDSMGWWDTTSHAYTPQEAGFYQCAWTMNFRDTAVIAANTYGYARLNKGSDAYVTINYGSGNALDLETSGSVLVECDGATSISLQALMLAGTSLSLFGFSPYRTFFSVAYLGKRPVY